MPPFPIRIDDDYSEGECRDSKWQAAADLELRADPRLDAPVVLKSVAGQTLTEVGKAEIVTEPVARITVERDGQLNADLHVRKGDLVYLLTPGSEGFYAAWANGKQTSAMALSACAAANCDTEALLDHRDERLILAHFSFRRLDWKRLRDSVWRRLRDSKGRTGWAQEGALRLVHDPRRPDGCY